MRSIRFDCLSKRTEAHTTPLQLLKNADEMRNTARQPIQLVNNQNITRLQPL